ncbi:alpha/beta fold hydrolase [Streptomyces albofaciens JCM 4342]|uniref:alpha/beta fold hydrolase n=1 Tax=Streptomyces albofaciens TaxID=66866 RepID=UPI00123B3819|nr:alpha/beta fold hydrolase [Streptomyces albofaciens]KAA6213347.1 alpha/beta fold hydrolase [Streptomyces albofaciens JCM 4342]
MSTIYKSAAGEQQLRRRYEETLAAWPVTAEHLRIPTREGETFVLASGPPEAPPLVLLHGAGANASMWQGDIATWSRHFRTYAVDLIGEPGLSSPSRPPLASDAYARWLDDVLDGLEIGTAPVVATSLGGWMALDHAIRRPGRVTRLALLCPGGVGGQRMGLFFKALLLRPLGRWGMRRSARSATGLNTPQAEPVLDQVVLTFQQFRPRTERLPVFTDDALRGLGIPLLVIAGTDDAVFDSAGTVRRVRENVPDATVRLLAGVGHAIFGQTDEVLAFLRK